MEEKLHEKSQVLQVEKHTTITQNRLSRILQRTQLSLPRLLDTSALILFALVLAILSTASQIVEYFFYNTRMSSYHQRELSFFIYETQHFVFV